VFQIINSIQASATLQLYTFSSFLSRKKNSLSIFIIEIAICHSQGALVPLSLLSAGSNDAKNSWRREPLHAEH
jgi:hypothetical protein